MDLNNIPKIKVSDKPLTKKIVTDLNKLSALLLQKQSGGKKRKYKTRKVKRSKCY